MKITTLPILLVFCLSCKPAQQRVNSDLEVEETRIEIFEEEVRAILSEDAEIKTITSGFYWAEGPLWLKEQEILLFTDVPANKIYSWSERQGLSVYLTPSGYTGNEPKREGANGLLLNNEGKLVLCQHGDRRVATMETPLDKPEAKFATITDNWNGKRLNSPNDAAFFGEILYFTDPSYGLPKQESDPGREIPFNGVYYTDNQLVTSLFTDDLSRPNGIAFSADSLMYVSNSDPSKALWMKYDMKSKSKTPKILYDATALTGKVNGLPDGLKIHPTGYVFATGPGGIWIFSPEDTLSARIHIPQATANCAFDDDFSYLYIAADSIVIRLQLIASAQK